MRYEIACRSYQGAPADLWELGAGNMMDGRAKTAASLNIAIAAARDANILI
jgi:hypothetical protein